jgi:hypothetical protein
VGQDGLPRAAPHVDDPARDALEDDEDGDGESDAYRREPRVVPIPFRSPSIGLGGALTGGFIFRIDSDDRNSTSSLAGFGSHPLWSAGFGLRFRLTEQNRMNYRADAAWGRDGFEFYFSLTEAF